jgi:hypothetical protein
LAKGLKNDPILSGDAVPTANAPTAIDHRQVCTRIAQCTCIFGHITRTLQPTVRHITDPQRSKKSKRFPRGVSSPSLPSAVAQQNGSPFHVLYCCRNNESDSNDTATINTHYTYLQSQRDR